MATMPAGENLDGEAGCIGVKWVISTVPAASFHENARIGRKCLVLAILCSKIVSYLMKE
jgi:hypothetical protein